MDTLWDIGRWERRRYLVAGVVGVLWLVLSGIPTGLLDMPYYYRMTPVVWWDYPFWFAGAVFVGLVAATYVGAGGTDNPDRSEGKTLTGALFSVFAIGCPICNALVVAVLGTGALWATLRLSNLCSASSRRDYCSTLS